jgi:hypothetical protein
MDGTWKLYEGHDLTIHNKPEWKESLGRSRCI